MRQIKTSAFEVAQRYVGMAEVPGTDSNPAILAMLKLDGSWPHDDAVPWCSAFMNWIAWHLRLPRSKSLRARSWLNVGEVIALERADPGFDVVILKRGVGAQPGPGVINAPGHVGLYAGTEGSKVLLLGGNQKDQVSVAGYSRARILGIRRLA